MHSKIPSTINDYIASDIDPEYNSKDLQGGFWGQVKIAAAGITAWGTGAGIFVGSHKCAEIGVPQYAETLLEWTCAKVVAPEDNCADDDAAATAAAVQSRKLALRESTSVKSLKTSLKKYIQ